MQQQCKEKTYNVLVQLSNGGVGRGQHGQSCLEGSQSRGQGLGVGVGPSHECRHALVQRRQQLI